MAHRRTLLPVRAYRVARSRVSEGPTCRPAQLFLEKSLSESAWRYVAPRGRDCDTKASCFCRSKAHMRGAPASPPALRGNKDAWLGADECLLLVRSQLKHTPILIGITKGREDLSANSEVRMPHVTNLASLGHAEGQASKAMNGHRCISLGGTRLLAGVAQPSARSWRKILLSPLRGVPFPSGFVLLLRQRGSAFCPRGSNRLEG